MQPIKRIRRNRAEWQQIVESWQSSGLSAPKFCEAHTLPYASFCQWRRKLSPVSENKPEDSGFLNLSSLGESLAGNWHITLKLGGDVELVLSRQ